jgi:hypothetical protein
MKYFFHPKAKEEFFEAINYYTKIIILYRYSIIDFCNQLLKSQDIFTLNMITYFYR